MLVERQMGGESSFQQHHSHGWDGVLSRELPNPKVNPYKQINMRNEAGTYEAEAASGVDLSCQVPREEQEAVEDPRRHDERREP